MTASWQSVASATAASGGDPVVNTPSGTVDGDLLVAWGIATAGHVMALAGKTSRPESVGTNGPLWIWFANSEPANRTFEVTGGLGNSQAVIARITGVDPGDPIDEIQGIASTGALVIPSLTPSGPDKLLFQGVAKNSNTTFTPPGTAAERWDSLALPNNFGNAGGDEIVGAVPTGTRTWTPSSGSTTPGVGYMIALNSVPPGEGQFAGAYAFAGSGFEGQAGAGQGEFSGGYAFDGSGFTGEAPGISSGEFAGGYSFDGVGWTGQAPTPPGDGGFLPPDLTVIPPGMKDVNGSDMRVPSAGARNRRRGWKRR
jgi:hypothetical protein